jgi:hypothetical protein
MKTTTQHTVTFEAPCWLFSGGKAAWYFVTLPAQDAAEIAYFSKLLNGGKRVGWGSIRVSVQIGKTNWETSIFPASQLSSYLLPIKASVRKVENIAEGSLVKVTLAIPMP